MRFLWVPPRLCRLRETRDYQHDGLGRWAQKVDGSKTTDYLHDGDHLLLERESTGAVTEYSYYPGVDRPHSLRRGSSVHYYVTDHPGSVVALLTESDTIANRYVSDPFGVHTGETRESVPNPLRFQALYWDASSDLYYVRARWYSPELRRFISEDPIGLEGGINSYVFAGNDPVNFRDPSGLDPCEWNGAAYQCPELVVTGGRPRSRTHGDISCWSMAFCDRIKHYIGDGLWPSVGEGAFPQYLTTGSAPLAFAAFATDPCKGGQGASRAGKASGKIPPSSTAKGWMISLGRWGSRIRGGALGYLLEQFPHQSAAGA